MRTCAINHKAIFEIQSQRPMVSQAAMEEAQTRMQEEQENAKATRAQVDELLSWVECFEKADIGTKHLQIDRAGGCPNRVQGAHQIQDFTEAVPRSGVILIGDFFAGLSEYVTNNHFQKAMLCGTLIVL